MIERTISRQILYRDGIIRGLRNLRFESDGTIFVDLTTFDEVVWSATYPSETDV